MSNSEELNTERVEVGAINKATTSAVHTQVKVVLSPEADLAIRATKHTANVMGHLMVAIVATEVHL